MAVAAPVIAWAAANAATITAVSAAAAVAAQGYSMYSQNQAAKAEAHAADEQNQEAAIQDAAAYDDLTPAEIDANKQANDAAMAQQAESIQAQGRVNLFAAASGTLGGSVDSMLFDIDTVRSKNINSIISQRESGLTSIRKQAEQIRQGALSSQNRQAINSPSWIEGGLKIGASVMQGLSSYQDTLKATNGLQKVSQTTQSSQIKGGV
ncbi:MAG: hypothetical protein [Bacteriophage sp.]|nr:MAG: hypothetical protein [Bacteriophage sp.]